MPTDSAKQFCFGKYLNLDKQIFIKSPGMYAPNRLET